MANPTTDGLAMVTYMTALNADGTFATSGGTGTNGNTFFDYFSSPLAVTARAWAASTPITYSFDAASNWSLAEKNAYLQGMANWQNVGNITFAAAAAGQTGALVFQRDTTNNASESDNLDTTPINGTPNTPAALTSALVKIGTVPGASWQFIDSFSGSGGDGPGTVSHEIFHALGMGHPGPYNGNSAIIQRYATDSQKYTVMSYVSQNSTSTGGNTIAATMSDPASINYTSWTYASGGATTTYSPTTPQMYDILATQRLYGTPTASTLTGGQRFGFNSNVTYTAFDGTSTRLGAFDFTVNTHPVVTLYDLGLGNTLDLSGFTADTTETVDLNAGAFSSVAGLVNNVGIAFSTRIDTAQGGGGHSTFIANGNADTINGGTDATSAANTANTVRFAGNMATYTLARDAQGVVTATKNAATSTLTNIQSLQFADQTLSTASLACFAAGTRLLTARGEVDVAALAVGDRVMTLSGTGASLKPVRWIGSTRVVLDRHPDPWRACPVRILAGAFADNVPHADLLLSPDHALLIDGALIPAHLLTNGTTIRRDPAKGVVRYFHVELDRHDILLAEGLAAESYLDTGNRGMFDSEDGLRALHPQFVATWSADSCRALVQEGPGLAQTRAELAARATRLGWAETADPGLLVTANGAAVTLDAGGCGVIPAGTTALQITSRQIVPQERDPANSDRRSLGVALRALRIDGEEQTLAGTGLHRAEHEAGTTWRWTDGAAVLSLPPQNQPARLSVEIHAGWLSYMRVIPAGSGEADQRAA